MSEHDFDHVEFVRCTQCGKVVDCYEYYNKDSSRDFGDCHGDIMLQKYDEEKGVIQVLLHQAIDHEVSVYRNLLNLALSAKKSFGSIEQFRRWKTGENNDVTIRLIIQENKVE